MNGIEKSDAAGPYPDEQYMRRAIELAKRGSGHVNPNPLVGAVIVRDGEILGEGWHEEYGELHAERNAIAHARAAGALLPLWKDAALHGGDYRGRNHDGGSRFG